MKATGRSHHLEAKLHRAEAELEKAYRNLGLAEREIEKVVAELRGAESRFDRVAGEAAVAHRIVVGLRCKLALTKSRTRAGQGR
jgi:multidrug resistance efflux pump